MCGILTDAFYIGLIFHRIALPEKRANTIIFSHNALIRRGKHDSIQLVFRVAEMRKHHLCEAHIRCYAVRHERDGRGETHWFQTHRMRLSRPSESGGAMLFMTLPQMIVHELDASSPLVPQYQWESSSGLETWRKDSFDLIISRRTRQTRKKADAADRVSGAGQNASEVGDLEPAPLVTLSDVLAQAATKLRVDTQEPVFPAASEANATPDERSARRGAFDMIQAFLEDREIEIIVLLEGTDPTTSNTVQARHSYKGEEIIFDHAFAPCVGRDSEGACQVDFDKFHYVVPD